MHAVNLFSALMSHRDRGAKYAKKKVKIRDDVDVLCTTSLHETHYNMHSIRGSTYLGVFRTVPVGTNIGPTRK
jgi:hypothetical protein